jgi:tetratricopeptide (TPR) repeat protein
VDQAGQWFQRAIVIDPNRELAYRYWGDALKAAGANDEARDKYIDAIVASPYERLAWVGLSAWAKQAHATLANPQVPKLQEPVYQETRAAWHNQLFARKYPGEKEYRHTLAEETDALRAVLKAIDDSKISEDQLDPGLRNLSILNRDEMLEAFVLISAADNGIGKDYPAYRETHRDQLHAYIAKYLIHPAPTP